MTCNEAVLCAAIHYISYIDSSHHHHQAIFSGPQDSTMMLQFIVGPVLFDLIVILKSLGEIITNV